MEIYKSFFDARSQTSEPLYAHLDGQGCWLVQKPFPRVIESAAFRPIPTSGLSLTRSFELGQVAEYYSSACRGIGANGLINLFSSEQLARQDYEGAVRRHDEDSNWQRVGTNNFPCQE
jgi:hypothetical protein